jgi:hypothetical protein
MLPPGSRRLPHIDLAALKDPMSISRRSIIALALLFTVALGCGRKQGMETAPVSGKVTYKGKPVPNGTVMFVPAEGPAATGEIGPDGSYKLTTYANNDGAVLGTHKVSITALQDTGGGLPEQRSGTPPSLLPSKYLSHDTSGLTAEVKASDNQVNFDLPN